MSARTLNADAFANARQFIETQGRPLEAALLRYHFDAAPRESVLDSLAAFRNEDGGFGHAIEPDLRAPESSAIGTSVAGQILCEVDAASDAALAKGARRYLLDTLDHAQWGWRIVPPSVEASPHAPWWNQTGRDHGYDDFSVNPTADVLAFLLEIGNPSDSEVVEKVAAAVVAKLEGAEMLEMHDLLCVLRLFSASRLPDALREVLVGTLPAFVDRAVVRDPEAWGAYGLRPLQVADGPRSPFLPVLEAAVAHDLDYVIATQAPDGSWAPTWSWGDAWPDVWPQARREWAGVLTLRNLLTLRRFGRISA